MNIKDCRVGEMVMIKATLIEKLKSCVRSSDSRKSYYGKAVTISYLDRVKCRAKIFEDGQEDWWEVSLFEKVEVPISVEIKNEFVYYYTSTTKRESTTWELRRKVPLVKLLKNLEVTKNIVNSGGTEALPNGTRFYSRIGQSEVIVLEQAPKVVDIMIGEDAFRSDGKSVAKYFLGKWENRHHVDKPFKIAYPYVIFVAYFQEKYLRTLSVYFSNESICDINNPLFCPHTLNTCIDSSGFNTVCLGDYETNTEQSLCERVNDLLDYFWHSEWGDDYYDYDDSVEDEDQGLAFVRNRDLDKRVKTFSAWQTATERDPLFVCKINWVPTDLTVGQAMAAALRDDYGDFGENGLIERSLHDYTIESLTDVIYQTPEE
ncbi:MAG: hypothetical protein WC449_01875 [Candidatus Paceibacterota bacterium]